MNRLKVKLISLCPGVRQSAGPGSRAGARFSVPNVLLGAKCGPGRHVWHRESLAAPRSLAALEQPRFSETGECALDLGFVGGR
jgi:hypothetical protein